MPGSALQDVNDHPVPEDVALASRQDAVFWHRMVILILANTSPTGPSRPPRGGRRSSCVQPRSTRHSAAGGRRGRAVGQDWHDHPLLEDGALP